MINNRGKIKSNNEEPRIIPWYQSLKKLLLLLYKKNFLAMENVENILDCY